MRTRSRAPGAYGIWLACAVVLSGCQYDEVEVNGLIHNESGIPVWGATVTLSPAPESGDRVPPTVDTTFYGGNTGKNFSVQLPLNGSPESAVSILRVEARGYKPYEVRLQGAKHHNLDITLARVESVTGRL